MNVCMFCNVSCLIYLYIILEWQETKLSQLLFTIYWLSTDSRKNVTMNRSELIFPQFKSTFTSHLDPISNLKRLFLSLTTIEISTLLHLLFLEKR